MSEEDRIELAELWRRAKAGDRRAVEDLVIRYAWLPAKVAGLKRSPPQFDRDDIRAWANFGLFDAVRKFDPTSGNGQLHGHFIGYATLRINGAILDGMKAPGQSWATRDVWRRVKAVSAAEEFVAQELGRPGTRAEIAAHLGVTERELPVFQWQVGMNPPGTGDGSLGPWDLLADVVTTEGEAEVADIAGRLAAKVVCLSWADQALAASLFYEGLDVGHVAEATGARRSRVCKSRAEMLLRLRDLLQRA